jgi:hypothetical protein
MGVLSQGWKVRRLGGVDLICGGCFHGFGFIGRRW